MTVAHQTPSHIVGNSSESNVDWAAPATTTNQPIEGECDRPPCPRRIQFEDEDWNEGKRRAEHERLEGCVDTAALVLSPVHAARVRRLSDLPCSPRSAGLDAGGLLRCES